ncbi:MAG: hypothetical protein QOE25_1395 [Actinomycetota bacterium]|nr:hypothetical protein [Actinomycetota bacterium]
MTFSIVGVDLEKGDWGVAVASKFPAVGAVVPWATAGIGAVATQSWANTTYGPEGLALMGSGVAAQDALDRLVDADEHKPDRQAGFVDVSGSAATFTGTGCSEWAGGVTGERFAAQGNILTGPEVVAEMAEAFTSTEGDLCDKLLASLLAGDAAGGDRRGRQSAALLVVREKGGYDGGNDRYVDLRVDDHPSAASEMARLFEIWDGTMLVRNDPLLEATPELLADLQARLTALGRFHGAVSGDFDAATREAMNDFAGTYNLEGRLRDDALISQLLVREIRDLTPEIREPS